MIEHFLVPLICNQNFLVLLPLFLDVFRLAVTFVLTSSVIVGYTQVFVL